MSFDIGFNEYLSLCDEIESLKKRIKDLEKDIEEHYRIYGYEKSHYLKETLEKHFNTKFKIDGLDTEHE